MMVLAGREGRWKYVVGWAFELPPTPRRLLFGAEARGLACNCLRRWIVLLCWKENVPLEVGYFESRATK
jgi:hypothetical protein